jgi:hypothetical protein
MRRYSLIITSSFDIFDFFLVNFYERGFRVTEHELVYQRLHCSRNHTDYSIVRMFASHCF